MSTEHKEANNYLVCKYIPFSIKIYTINIIRIEKINFYTFEHLKRRFICNFWT